MIGLLPVIRVICSIAAIYAFFTALIYGGAALFSANAHSSWGAATFALSGSGLLQILLMFWFYYGWKKFWQWIPALNRWLYPDISGTWDMEIALGGANTSGKNIEAIAIIQQDFLRISMEVVAPKSTSSTLAAFPRRRGDSSLPELYYVFLITTLPEPGKPSDVYKGAAILDLDHIGDGELRGNYWTSAETSGHYRLYNRRRSATKPMRCLRWKKWTKG